MVDFPESKIVEKPWGREVWFAYGDLYVGKLLEVDAGQRLSLQYHEVKHESMYLLKGRMRFVYADDVNVENLRSFELSAPKTVVIPPGSLHRVEALEDVVIVEVSTPHLDDLVRVEDDHGRK